MKNKTNTRAMEYAILVACFACAGLLISLGLKGLIFHGIALVLLCLFIGPRWGLDTGKSKTLEILYRCVDGSEVVTYRRPAKSADAKEFIRQINEMQRRDGSECRYRYRTIEGKGAVSDEL